LLIEMATARTFEIKVLNTPTIKIGGQDLSVGNHFDDKEEISWSSDNQAMKVLSDDNKVFVLSKMLFSKVKGKSLYDYLTTTKTASVRNDGENFPITLADHRVIFENEFVLLDSLTFNVGWRTNDTSYFEAKTTNLGENNFSFILPANDNELTISRELMPQSVSESGKLAFTISYIEKEYGETTLITDAMVIEIVPLDSSIAEEQSIE
ncbi:MAG: hypothetical protein K2G64_07910, partial [Muribaculaceae bacterium]|nr:hypothetical protein [Muribaculaceae bacterium]